MEHLKEKSLKKMGRPRIWNSKAERDKAWWAAHPGKAAEYSRRRKEKNPEAVRFQALRCSKRHGRKYKLKRSYGLSLGQYAEILKGQNGKCAICSDTPPEKSHLSVDHEHEPSTVPPVCRR